MSSVVCKGDVSAVKTGNFVAAPLVETTFDKLVVGGSAVLTGVATTFTDPGPPTSDPVDWKGDGGKLALGGVRPLRAGTKDGAQGNALEASSPGRKLVVD
jgi:hypothetical protein